MSSLDLWSAASRFWRVPVVALLGGLLAFAGSFVVGPTYESSTRLLIRGRDSTVLNSNGENLSGEPGVIDSNLAGALGETQSALVSSTAVAEMVVDELALDRRTDGSSGLIGALKRAVAGTYHRAKAYLTHGFYDEPSDRQRAIDEVHAGLRAASLGDSYVLEVRGAAEEPDLAADITNAAADALITVTGDRFRAEAATERDFLSAQVQRAQGVVDEALAAKQAYETANGISQLPLELELGAVSLDDLRASLSTTQVEIQGAEAELASVLAQLDRTSPNDSSVSEVVTGRSNTQISSSAANPIYQQLVIRRDALESELASLRARSGAITARIDGTDSAASNEQEAELSRLDASLSAAQTNFQRLDAAFQEAFVRAERPGIEVTRIDEASVPTFPIRPLRYVYLALGLICGAVAGWALTWLRSGRRSPTEEEDDTWYDDEVDLDAVRPTVVPDRARIPALVGGPVAHEAGGNGTSNVLPAADDRVHSDDGAGSGSAPRVEVDVEYGTTRTHLGPFELFQSPPDAPEVG